MTKQTTADQFQIAYGDVVSSTIILVCGVDGVWSPFFKSNEPPPMSHSLLGLKAWMKERKRYGWMLDGLAPNGDNPHIYRFGDSRFWIPDVPKPEFEAKGGEVVRSEIVLRWDDTGHKWEPFPPKDRCTSLNTLKLWMKTHPNGGWADELLWWQECNIWKYGEAGALFYIPNSSPQLKGRAVCVNALGCETLTEGKEYERKGEDDGLVKVVDDAGVERPFLPERFKEKG